MRIATFNVQNLRLRSQDGEERLDGAADGDTSEPARTAALARADRRKTAEVIARADADIVALQEVFDIETLDYFHDRFLLLAGAQRYDHRYCLDGNDGRGLNVAALSRRKAARVTSHAGKTGADLGLSDLPPDLRDAPIFRRDCLELRFDAVTLFVCHFKAVYPDPKKAHAVRMAEARAVRRIVEKSFEDPARERWIILGDFNEPAAPPPGTAPALEVFGAGFAEDLLDRLPKGRDWTYEMSGSHLHTRPDRIFVSPALAREYPDATPRIIRSGLEAGSAERGRPRASDHALVFADFPGL